MERNTVAVGNQGVNFASFSIETYQLQASDDSNTERGFRWPVL